jgi:hypothetical protein
MNAHSYTFDSKKGEYARLVDWKKVGSAFSWRNPGTWFYFWCQQYELELEWQTCFDLKLTYMDPTIRSFNYHNTTNTLITVLATFFRGENCIEGKQLRPKTSIKTTIILPDYENPQFKIAVTNLV